MSISARFLAALLLAASQAAVAQAGTPVVVSVDSENPPFMWVRDGNAAGIYPAVITAAFARMDVPVRIEAKPWKRAIRELDEGKAGVGGIYKTDERAARYEYSEPILVENIAVYFNRDRPFDVRTVADLYGKKIGVLRGWSYGDAFDAAKNEGRIAVEEVSSDRSNFLKLAAGRIDAILAIEETGAPILAEERLTNITQGKVYLASNRTHLAFNRSAGQGALLARFSKAIAGMKKDGSFDEIVVHELAR